MTVSQLIEWLKEQDQGATVEVIKIEDKEEWIGKFPRQVDFTPELSDYLDLRGNQFVSPDSPYYNQRTLLLGSWDD